MRTIFTTNDIKNIIENIFKNNNFTVDIDDGEEKKQVKAFDFLNIRFYTWKNRLVETDDYGEPYSAYGAWVQSLNLSMDKSYALVELLDEEATASQDIDSSTKVGKITFLIQTNKASVLDYYISKVRNEYLGNPQIIKNASGEALSAYIVLGTLMYDEEPETTQLGECIQVSCGFRLTYLNNAKSYNDIKVSIALDGNFTIENGKITSEPVFLEMPFTKITWQNIITSNAMPMANRPDLTGFVATNISCVKTLTFYDFNKELSEKFDELLWSRGCFAKNGYLTATQDVNIPVYIKVVNGENTYIYKDMIDNMQKTLTNNDFTISSITLKGWGKL